MPALRARVAQAASARPPRTARCARSRTGRRAAGHTGLVQDACRIWDRCRSLAPGSWPRAWYRCSHGSVPRESIATIRSGPPPGVRQPPGAVSAGRPVPAGRGEAEPGPVPVPGPSRRSRSGPFPAAFRFGPRAAVPDGVAVLVGHRDAPGCLRGWPRRRRPGPGRARGRPGRARPAPRAGPASPAAVPSGTVSVTRPANPPAAAPAGPAPGGCCAPPPLSPPALALPALPPPVLPLLARRCLRCRCCRWRPGPPCRPGGARESLPRTRSRNARARSSSMPPSSPALRSSPGPPADPLITREHLIGRQLAAHQGGVAGVLGPPLHPREPRRRPPPLPRGLRRDLQHRAGQRGPQPARGQPPGPAQDLRPRPPGLRRRTGSG